MQLPMMMTVALLAQLVDLAGGGAERGKQRSGAGALVVVGHGGATALLHGWPGSERSCA